MKMSELTLSTSERVSLSSDGTVTWQCRISSNVQGAILKVSSQAKSHECAVLTHSFVMHQFSQACNLCSTSNSLPNKLLVIACEALS